MVHLAENLSQDFPPAGVAFLTYSTRGVCAAYQVITECTSCTASCCSSDLDLQLATVMLKLGCSNYRSPVFSATCSIISDISIRMKVAGCRCARVVYQGHEDGRRASSLAVARLPGGLLHCGVQLPHPRCAGAAAGPWFRCIRGAVEGPDQGAHRCRLPGQSSQGPTCRPSFLSHTFFPIRRSLATTSR